MSKRRQATHVVAIRSARCFPLVLMLGASSLFVLLALSTISTTVQGFSPIHLNKQTRQTSTAKTIIRRDTPLFSEPSDTSSTWNEDDIVDIDEGNVVEEKQEEMGVVNSLLDMLPSDATSEVSDDVRAALNEAVYRLEKLFPMKQEEPMTTSPLINGVWELKYAGGYSSAETIALNPSTWLPGAANGGGGGLVFLLKSIQTLIVNRLLTSLPGMDLHSSTFSSSSALHNRPLVEWTNLEVTIGRSQPRVEASVQFRLANSDRLKGTASVVARLDTMSDVRLRETYESISVSPFLSSLFSFGNDGSSSQSASTPIELPDALRYSRDLYVTYVDDDLLIVRDASGAPEVLVRKSMVFSRNWGNEPSDQDDLVPPGQEE